MTERCVKVIERKDGKERLCIIARDAGTYSFHIEFEDKDPYAGTYWSVRNFSGLYASLEEAEKDARQEITWLRPQP